jgi:hypothetical protein
VRARAPGQAGTVAALSLLFIAYASGHVAAQATTVVPPPTTTVPIAGVTVDLAAQAFDRLLPFDVPFFIAGRTPEGTVSLDVQYAVLPPSGDTASLRWMPGEPARWQPSRATAEDDSFLVLMPASLAGGRQYRFRFSFHNDRSGDTVAIANGHTGRKNYVSVDAGFLFAGDIGIGALYVGSNIYFRPVNKDAPLSSFGGIGRRLALTVGVTISSVADEIHKTRSDLFWNQSLVLGAGYRITSSIRGGAGALVFRESDPNPLVTRTSTAATWYASFSLDLDLLKGFAG